MDHHNLKADPVDVELSDVKVRPDRFFVWTSFITMAIFLIATMSVSGEWGRAGYSIPRDLGNPKAYSMFAMSIASAVFSLFAWTCALTDGFLENLNWWIRAGLSLAIVVAMTALISHVFSWPF